ncbi:dihydrofolate reductase [Candidatus Woesebacteria bacterium]|nr:dihydrofolate reductase [Candidatus Woesebacteria bacterium]
MNVTIIAVMSANGLITSDILGGPKQWASAEDLAQFNAKVSKSDAVVMGRKTYAAVRGKLHLRPKVLRIVMTTKPTVYSHVNMKDELEFTSKNPADIITDLRERGRQSILIAGGASIHTLFLQEHLVTDLCVTVEPYVFGSGTPFVEAYPGVARLKLMTADQINTRGSLLLHYKLLNNL